MKESGLQVEPLDKLQVSHRNRYRLILQNRKLLGEVHRLEQTISTVIEKTVTNQFLDREESQELHQKYKNEQEEQLRTIARMKREIKSVRAGLTDHKYDEIKDEQNQLTFLKRELEKLFQERETLSRKKHEKEEQLEYHKPINHQTASTLEQYKKTKAKNNELKSKIHELQREVGKYHQLKQLSKSSVPKQYDNPDYHLISMQNQINNMRKEMKKAEDKWKAKIESLDKEYFGFKQLKQNKLSELELLERDMKNYDNRAAGMRDEVAMINDRERISGVTISPQKRKEIQDLIEEERKKLKRLSPKAIAKNKNERNNRAADKQKSEKPTQMIKPNQNEIGKPHLNELKFIPELKSQQKPSMAKIDESEAAGEEVEQRGKGKKMIESIGVGTSFYYVEE